MYTAINSKGGRENGGLIYAFYFVMLTLCGDYTLLNVFLAIACDSLDQAAALTEAEEVSAFPFETGLDRVFFNHRAKRGGSLFQGGSDRREGVAPSL